MSVNHTFSGLRTRMQVLVHYNAMSYVLCKSVYCSVMHLRAILGDQIFGLKRPTVVQSGPIWPKLAEMVYDYLDGPKWLKLLTSPSKFC